MNHHDIQWSFIKTLFPAGNRGGTLRSPQFFVENQSLWWVPLPSRMDFIGRKWRLGSQSLVPSQRMKINRLNYMGVSKNRGTPKSSILYNRVFHCRPSILEYSYFWKHQYNRGAMTSIFEGQPTPNLQDSFTWTSEAVVLSSLYLTQTTIFNQRIHPNVLPWGFQQPWVIVHPHG